MIAYSILSFLFWPALIIGVIVYFARRRNKKTHPANDKEWYLQFSLSREDSLSQMFILLAFFFLGVTILAFNKDLGDPLSWRAIVLIISVLGLAGTYFLKTLYTLVFSLVGLVSWWGAQAALWIDGKDIRASGVFAGLLFLALLLFALGHLHERQIKYKRFALVYLILGIMGVTAALFFFSTKPGIGAIGEMTVGGTILGSWQLMLSLLVFVVSLIGVSIYNVMRKLITLPELGMILLLMILFGATALLPEQHMFLGNGSYSYASGKMLSGTGIIWALFYNVAVFLELLGLILSGYVRRETWLINLGAVFLFLLIIVKYFDWFFTFLDKSIFFIGAGILLFLVGWFMERGRRYMIANIKTQEQAH